jgi:hypothetical protein
VSKIQGYHPDLAFEIGKLMDFQATVMNEKFRQTGNPPVLDDPFIFSVFTQPFVSLFGSIENRFPAWSMALMDAEDETTALQERKVKMSHCDHDNGTEPGNDISATLSLFFVSKKIYDSLIEDGFEKEEAQRRSQILLHGREDKERLKRFFLVFFTRKAHEHFKNNEQFGEFLKAKLRSFRDRLNIGYQRFGGSFAKPQDMWFCDEGGVPFDSEVVNGIEHKFYKIPISYAREIDCSPGMTVLYRINCLVKAAGLPNSRMKMLEPYVVALLCGAWMKFYHAGMKFVSKLEATPALLTTNLACGLLDEMNEMYDNWRGGANHRGRTTSVDLHAYYSKQANIEAAVCAMDDFLLQIEKRRVLHLLDYHGLLKSLVENLHGVGLFFGGNFGLYCGLTGLVSRNLHNCFLSFPLPNQGSEATLITHDEQLKNEVAMLTSVDTDCPILQGSVMDQVRQLRLDPSLAGYTKTTRLISSFAGLEPRMCWVECLCCDGIGPNANKHSYVFNKQSMFWFATLNGRQNNIQDMRFQPQIKLWGSQLWCDVQFFSR